MAVRAADPLDAARDREQELLEEAIERTRRTPIHLAGDRDCRKCSEPNDRADDGYAVCSECMRGGV